MNRFGWLLLAAPLATTAEAGEPAHAPDPVVGNVIALNVCSACHVVASAQPEPPILRPPAPTFRSIANRRGITEEWLRGFVTTTHRTVETPGHMPNPNLMDAQVDDVAAYIMTLRRKR